MNCYEVTSLLEFFGSGGLGVKESLTHLDRMPVTVNLKGGIGNQLFQIASGMGLAERFRTDFYILENNFEGCGQGSHPSKYYNTLFQKVPRKHQPASLIRYNEREWTYYNLDAAFTRENPATDHIQLNGYFQSEKYFPESRKAYQSLFAAPEFVHNYCESRGLKARYPELFDPHDYCLLGVRRGDYLKHPTIHNPCGMDYFKKAMALNPASKYYITSDDMAWCKKNFVGDQFVFLECETDLDDLYIGLFFDKYIMPNSTFHWWISYLSFCETPRVIAPDKWIYENPSRHAYGSIYRDDMIVVERLVEV